MGIKNKRRQQKLERRHAKRKERHRSLVKLKNRGLAERLMAAARAPIVDSLVNSEIEDGGMAQALLSRRLPNGDVAFSMFLVDRWCLGIKNALGKVGSAAEYAAYLRNLKSEFALVELPPADLRCLVEDAVEYARELGFEPHPDYHRVKPILGDIDPQQAEKRFPFGGHDGKPHFFAGPFDDPQRCYQIMSILEHHCGKGGFHYTMPLLGETPVPFSEKVNLISVHEDDEFEDDDDDDLDDDDLDDDDLDDDDLDDDDLDDDDLDEV